MLIAETLDALTSTLAQWRQEGFQIALVPTMGALHPGHMALIEKAKSLGPKTKVIVSVFVNPTQFAPSEDFDTYPRPKARDMALCYEYDVDLVFNPEPDVLYPLGLDHRFKVVPPQTLDHQLCGLSRPPFFTGVSTVCLKLFNVVQPDVAVFGEKDYQQLTLLRHMVRDLFLPITILAVPTVRDSNGLALSSRNSYLTTESLQHQARLLSRLLKTAIQLYQQGQTDAADVIEQAKSMVLNDELYPDVELDYLEIRHADTLSPVTTLDDDSRVLIAAKVGGVRLIDNASISDTAFLASRASVLEVLGA